MHPLRIRRRDCTWGVLLAAGSCLALSGCLEHKERIVVADDGSVQLTVLAKGSPSDLVDGAMVPSGTGWTPQGTDVAAWSELFAKGGRKAVLDETLWKDALGLSRGDVEIGATASLASVSALPRTHATSSDPYPEAEPRFTTRLDVRSESGRRVYSFERTYHALPGTVFRLWKALETSPTAPENFIDRIWGGKPFSPEEKESVALAVSEQLVAVGSVLAREAVAAHYREGSATLRTHGRTRVLEQVRGATSSFATVQRLVAILDAERARAEKRQEGPTDPSAPSPLVAMDQSFRNILRAELRASLAKEGLAEGEVNGVLRALEVELAGTDRAQDLVDDEFKVEVVLPGTIVGGNFSESEGSTARFHFSGADVVGQDVVLRATSVVEPVR